MRVLHRHAIRAEAALHMLVDDERAIGGPPPCASRAGGLPAVHALRWLKRVRHAVDMILVRHAALTEWAADCLGRDHETECRARDLDALRDRRGVRRHAA